MFQFEEDADFFVYKFLIILPQMSLWNHLYCKIFYDPICFCSTLIDSSERTLSNFFDQWIRPYLLVDSLFNRAILHCIWITTTALLKLWWWHVTFFLLLLLALLSLFFFSLLQIINILNESIAYPLFFFFWTITKQ